MMEILWDGELGPAYLVRVLWKALPAKVTFEQRRERREIELTLSRAERRVRVKALRQKNKLEMFEEQKTSQRGWSLVSYVGVWLKELRSLERGR